MKRKKDPQFTESRNQRKQPFKYYYADEEHNFAVEGGRCYKCDKITDAFCDQCEKWICQNHMVKPDVQSYECFCQNCFKQ